VEPVIDGYTSDLDELAALAAVDIEPPPPDFYQWNEIRARMGRPCGTFWEYLDHTDRNTFRHWPALILFDAVPDDDYIPDEVEL